MSLTDDIKRPQNAHIWQRETNEHYVEEIWCSRRLFEVEKFDGDIRDPACGFGRIVESARLLGYRASGSDIAQRAPHYPVADFLQCGDTMDNLVSNPPFKQFRNFALHGLCCVRRKMALIWQVPRLNAAGAWLEATPLARVWFMTPRPSMPPGWAITAGNMPNGDKPQGGTQDYCWLVWDKDHDGPATMHWLRRDVR